MNSKACVLGAAGVLALCGGLWFANAGPLTPDPGPVSPTNRTLGEIYDRIDLLTPGPFCDNGPWEFAFLNFNSGNPVQMVSGSGVLHAVICAPTPSSVSVFTDSGASQIGEFQASNWDFDNGGTPQGVYTSEKWTLNVRYTNGLSVTGIGRVTLLYRPDTP
ncbi:MAG: hypothetical protein AAGK04_07075 [Planctomycetota bacterium]